MVAIYGDTLKGFSYGLAALPSSFRATGHVRPKSNIAVTLEAPLFSEFKLGPCVGGKQRPLENQGKENIP